MRVDLGAPASSAVQQTRTPAFKLWEDLLPRTGAVADDDPYAGLTDEQLAELAMLARMVRLLNTGKADTAGAMARDADRIRNVFADLGIDADWLLSQRERVREDRIRRSLNPDVDGHQVRLLGIVAPLSWEEDMGVREFLLTAAMGKCSHEPPPPFNQVARIRTADAIDVTALAKEQGTPDPWVWVEGTIRYGATTHQVFRGDGMMRIEAAYAIEPLRIVPASAAELARRAEEARREAEALLFPNLTDLVSRS